MLVTELPILNRMIIGTKPSIEECCGFFFGYENDEYRTISKSMAVMNASEGDGSGNFEITSKDYLYAEQI